MASKSPRRSLRLRIFRVTRALICFVAGILVGAGLLLYGQVRLAEYFRDEVFSTFFLWRAIGDATYFLQGTDVQVALTLSKLPAESIVHSKRLAITLIVLGGELMLLLPFLKPRRRR